MVCSPNPLFDYNGYFPDGIFRYNVPTLGGYFSAASFDALEAIGLGRPNPPYGPRAEGTDESNEVIGCDTGSYNKQPAAGFRPNPEVARVG